MVRSATLEQQQLQPAQGTRHDAPTTLDLDQVLAGITATVAPLWPLRDYVAVNPFLGLADRRFLDAYRQIKAVRDCELLADPSHYESLILRGEVTPADLEQALIQCASEYPGWFDGITREKIVAHLVRDAQQSEQPGSSEYQRLYYTLAEIVDRVEGGAWTSHIINDVTRHCAAHYDQGQAAWPSPWKNLPLYTAWRRSASMNPRMDMLGLKGYRALVASLPPSPRDAIVRLLNKLGVAEAYWPGLLLCQLMSVAGWASYVKYSQQDKPSFDPGSDDLVGLIAIRLAYDVALLYSGHAGAETDAVLEQALPARPGLAEDLPPSADVLIRYAMQVAVEAAYRRKTLSQIDANPPSEQPFDSRKAVQMVFCIDVRSEVVRRHLESLDDAIETMGFAGFFGVPIEYVTPGQHKGDAHCPVLLKPTLRACDRASDNSEAGDALRAAGRQRWGGAWKRFKNSAVSCFSFVESLGLLYAVKLIGNTFVRPVRAVSGARCGEAGHLELQHQPSLPGHAAQAVEVDSRVALCAGILKNLGLTEGFARLVVVCGHEAGVVNNPYKAGLACGACGGHSGAPNARVVAGMLNDPRVRAGLADQGIAIPQDTWFVPAVHDTTTDQIRLMDTGGLPASHEADVRQLDQWIDEAGRLTRAERSGRLSEQDGESLMRRGRDWSEVRPEWGLAGNAAFIVAPRSRTRGLDLGGRVFMHNYDPAKDPDHSVLELILTAPMIVTSWINLQYYASATDNQHFGSGTKTLHNVVGNFGVLSGNGGDLKTGLPWQSVHDGAQLQHQPLRLLVIVESTRAALDTIIRKHASVRDLVENGWLTIAVIEAGQAYRRGASGRWALESAA